MTTGSTNQKKIPKAPLPHLYAIVDSAVSEDPLAHIEALMETGVRLLQVRAKNLSKVEIKKLVRHALDLKVSYGGTAKIIVNDHIDICAELGADGVHLGQGDASPQLARSELGKDALIGLSTHNIEQLIAAQTLEIDYVALGPIFHSKTKSGHAPTVGLEVLQECFKQSKHPIVAIGGITKENARSVLKAGASSVAIIRDLLFET